MATVNRGKEVLKEGRSGTYLQKPWTKTQCNGYKHQTKTYCIKRPGWGTDHLGEGRCKFHGGSVRVRHGKQSVLSRYRDHEILGERIARAQDDPDVLSLVNEVGLIQAIMEDFVEQNKHQRFKGKTKKELLDGIALLASLKEKSHKINLAWTDKRAEGFLEWLGESLSRILEEQYGKDERVGRVLLALAELAEKFRV